MGFDSESKRNSASYGGVIAICAAFFVVALFVGVVLPQAGDLLLSELGDVQITDPLDGQVLTYNYASGKWINLNDTDIIRTYSFSNLTDSGIKNLIVNQTLIYNGTNWVNQNQTAPFAVNGWDDLNFPALSLAKSANLAPSQSVIFASGSIEGLLFNGATQVNEVYGSGEVLHSYKQGSDLYPHVHWMASTADAGNVTWFLEYTIADANAVYSAPITISVTQATTSAAWVHRLAEFPAINGTGLTIGAQIAFRLYRNATTPTDTYTANAALLSFGIHYQINSVGSISRISK